MIRLRDVRAGYRMRTGATVVAVDGVSLDVGDNEILGIAGESGCGKTTLVKLIYGQIGNGLHLFDGVAEWQSDNGTIGPDDVKSLWWDRITYIPQVLNTLNPVMRVEDQVLDSASSRKRRAASASRREELTKFFEHLGLPASVFRSYPHQLSGGMLQRVLIGMAAFPRPALILADEPTSALDVVVQKRILLLLHGIQREQNNALVLVSHDLGVHFQITDRLAIAYAGKIVEIGPTRELFAQPRHPYTAALVEALPRAGDHGRRKGLAGRPPNLWDPPDGCRFAARCPAATDRCRNEDPEPRNLGNMTVACHHPLGGDNA